MRRATRGLCASLAVAVGGTALAADPTPAVKPWYARLTGDKPAAKPDPDPTFANSTPRLRTVGPLDPNVLLDALKAEQAAWDRRLEVCRRMREIAAETNNDALHQQAVALEQQATALYAQRAARLGVKGFGGPDRKSLPAPELPTAAAPVPAPSAPFKVVTP